MGSRRKWEDQVTAAYIRDDQFAWLPVNIVSKTNDAEALVKVSLPEDWHKVTCNSKHHSLTKSDESNKDGHVLRKVILNDYIGNTLPLRSADEDDNSWYKIDIGDLSFIHEASILYNLRHFHSKGIPYTRVNDVVISMNPFHWINGMYSSEKQQLYANKFVWKVDDNNKSGQDALTESKDRNDIAPHIYETSCKAYRGMIVDKRNQTILVAGVSGAGKTEAVKIVMNQLATLYRTETSLDCTTESRLASYSAQIEDKIKVILESNPIFESFGNAKTVNNDNSSRFGKFTELTFDVQFNTRIDNHMKSKYIGHDEDKSLPSSILVGSSFQTFLLEKSRVVAHSPLERSFHIFYQFLSAPQSDKLEIWDDLCNKNYDSFTYLSNSITSNDIDDKEAWKHTKRALQSYGVTGEKFILLFRAIYIVLQLGNLTFSGTNGNEDISSLKSDDELSTLCTLMDLSKDEITKALTTRQIDTATDNISANLSLNDALECRDALAKEAYFQLFNMLVEQMNQFSRTRDKPKGTLRSINLLDIFGFEVFTKNRFEQLCINYANERLQKIYVLENFLQVQEEYTKEGINVCDFSEVDNAEAIDMIQGRMGLISILNDECLRPCGNDASFVQKLKIVFKISDSLIHKPLHKPTEFAINHFAGIVTYDATNFVKKNTDEISKDALACASRCTNYFIKSSFQNLLDSRLAMLKQKGRKKIVTITSKFRSQLNDLVIKISSTQIRFIRCIKPNDDEAPCMIDHLSTVKQLSSLGIITAITMSREAFPNSLFYNDVCERFNCLSQTNESGDLFNARSRGKQIVEILLGKITDTTDKTALYALGKTKIFFRPGSLEMLETARMDLYIKNATVIQSWIRMLNAISVYRLMLSSTIVVIQSNFRGYLSRKWYQKIKLSTIIIQCAIRCAWARDRLHQLKLNQFAAMIQCRWRFVRIKKLREKRRNAASVIQRSWLASKTRSRFIHKLAVCVDQAQKDKQLKNLQKQINSNDDFEGKNALLLECSSVMTYFRLELFKERSQTSNLRAQLENKTKETRSLESKVSQVSVLNSASIIENLILRKQIQQLKANIGKQAEVICEMKEEISGILVTSAEQTASLSNEIEQISLCHQKEIQDLNSQREEDEKKCHAEKDALRIENEELIRRHEKEIEKLKLEFESIEEENESSSLQLLNNVAGPRYNVPELDKSASKEAIEENQSVCFDPQEHCTIS